MHIYQHPQPHQRRKALQRIATLSLNDPLFPIVLDRFQDRSWPVREAAADVLGMTLAQTVTDSLLPVREMLAEVPLTADSPSPDNTAVWLTLEPQRQVRTLLHTLFWRGLRDRHPLVRMAAMRSMSQPTSLRSAVVQALGPILKHSQPRLRYRAADALAQFPAEATIIVPLLVRGASESHRRVRAHATRSLAQFAHQGMAPSVIWPMLLRRSYDGETRVRRIAHAAFVELPHSAAATLPPWFPLLSAVNLTAQAKLQQILEQGQGSATDVQDFVATCQRRACWQQRLCERELSWPTAPQADEAVALVLDAVTPSGRERECVWLLAEWVRLWLTQRPQVQ